MDRLLLLLADPLIANRVGNGFTRTASVSIATACRVYISAAFVQRHRGRSEEDEHHVTLRGQRFPDLAPLWRISLTVSGERVDMMSVGKQWHRV